MSAIKKLKRQREKQRRKEFKATQIINREKYKAILSRKKELESLGHIVLYYSEIPETIKKNRTVENFNELGCLIY